MRRQKPHLSTDSGHDEDAAAIALGAKGDEGGIGREGGLVVVGGMVGQAQRISAGGGLGPDFEGSIAPPGRRVSQKSAVGGGGRVGGQARHGCEEIQDYV